MSASSERSKTPAPASASARRPPPRARATGGATRGGGKGRANPLLARGDGTAQDASGGSAQNEPQDESAQGASTADPQPSHQRAVCTVSLCPICAFVTALDEVRPELAEHLVLAGREILMAIKAVIEARLNEPDDASDGASRPSARPNRRRGRTPRTSDSRLERIVVD